MNKSTIDKAEQEGIKQGIWYGEMFYRVIRI